VVWRRLKSVHFVCKVFENRRILIPGDDCEVDKAECVEGCNAISVLHCTRPRSPIP